MSARLATAAAPALLTALALGGIGCGPQAPPGYVEEIERYRDGREARLRAEDGWLSLIGLFWLDHGENRFGSDPANAIVLPADAAPATAGSLVVEDGEVRLVAPADAGITLDGEPVTGRLLRHDGAGGPPDVLHLGRLRLHVIRRGERLALRVKDTRSPALADFDGLDYFPIDPGYRVEARLERHAEPMPVEVATVVGTSARMLSPGRLRFRLAGASCSLEPLVGEPDETELFVIFRDETSGTETYGAGRYLYATLEEGDRVVLDFNKAYNPPCAFTPHATCPLPPPANRLAVAVRAGEMRYRDH